MWRVEGKNTQRDYFTVLFSGARKTGPERGSASENRLYGTWKGKPLPLLGKILLTMFKNAIRTIRINWMSERSEQNSLHSEITKTNVRLCV